MSTWINRPAIKTMTRTGGWWSMLRRDDPQSRGGASTQAAPEMPPAPPGTDLRWRPAFLMRPLAPDEVINPESGARLGDDAALWHDSRTGELRVQQVAASGEGAPYHLCVTPNGLGGSYLSLSVDLPPVALRDLSRAHILRMDVDLRLNEPLRVYVRLNLRHGPNADEMLRDLPEPTRDPSGRRVVEFDLAATEINERRLEKIWLDLIFENARDEVIELGDMILSRHLRASF